MIDKKDKILSLILKCITLISAALGVYMSAAAGRGSFMGGNRVFMYFTIQSNIAVALISAVGLILLLRGKKIPDGWYVVKFMGAVSITLTGAVFCFVLAPTFGASAWNVQNILTHVIVPVATVVDFFVAGIYGSIGKKYTVFVTLPPLAYAVYAGIGYAAGWQFAPGVNYPYFFLNWGSPAGAFGFSKELPFMGCAWWIAALFVLLMLVGYAYLALLGRRKKRHFQNEKS